MLQGLGSLHSAAPRPADKLAPLRTKLQRLQRAASVRPPWDRPVAPPPEPEPERPEPVPEPYYEPPAPASAQPAAAAAADAGQQQSFVSEADRQMFVPEQLVFLERKRRAAAGLGPLLPESAICTHCGGGGQVGCWQCEGTGMNAADKAEELFQSERGVIIQNNGKFDTRTFFMKDCPCWLCRGGGTIACTECGGSGMSGLGDYVTD